MERQKHLGLPHNPGAVVAKYVQNSLVRHVPFARGRQRTVQMYNITLGVGMTLLKKQRSLTRSHGVAAARA